MRPSRSEYPTPGWVSFQSATLGQFCIGTNNRIDLSSGAKLIEAGHHQIGLNTSP
jgi:hypothetical protein